MMVILAKLLRDFRLAKGQLLLLIIASGLSAWGISSVLYSYRMAERDFQVNFARTFPADIELVVDNYREGFASQLLADKNVIDLERREVLGGRIRNANGQWMPLVLFGVEDIRNMRLDVFRILDQEAGPQILIETNARYFLDPLQDSIEVQFPGSGSVKWKIGGTSHDARLAPARMERAVFAHATSLKLLEPFLKNQQRRFLIKTNVSPDKKSLQQVAERLKALGDQGGCTVKIISIPTPGEHMHQNIVDGISFLQRSMGLILSIMGLILLSLILLTWIFPRISDVGVMKAIGASTKLIFSGYTLALLLIITAGLVLGMPLGYQTAAAYNKLVAYIQNFEPVTEMLPLWVHLAVVLSSVAIPLLFTTLVLSRASQTTVNEALNKTFYTPHRAFFQLSRVVMAGSTLQYCVNNLFRNAQRTLLLIFLTAVGVALFLLSLNLEYSVRKELDHFANSAQYRLRVRFAEEKTLSELQFLYELPFVRTIAPMRDLTVTYQPPNAAHSETKTMRVLSSNHMISDELVLEGEVNKDCQTCLYISGEAMRQEFAGTSPGTPVELTLQPGQRKTYRYAGIFKDMAAIGSPFFLFDDKLLSSLNALAFEIRPGYSNHEVTNGVDDLLLENGIDLAGILDVEMRMRQLEGHLQPSYLIIKITGLFTVLLGLVGLLIVLNLTLEERTREIGIMKAIGCSSRKISKLFGLEFLLTGALSLILGVLMAMPLNAALCKILSETVIYHQIPAKNHVPVILLTGFSLLLIQILLIFLFNRVKLRKNARTLLDHHF